MPSLFHQEAERLRQYLASSGTILSCEQALEAIAASKGYKSFAQAKRRLRLNSPFSWKRVLSKRELKRALRAPPDAQFYGNWIAKFSLEDCDSFESVLERLYQIANTFDQWRQQGAVLLDNADGHILLATANKRLAIKEGWDLSQE